MNKTISLFLAVIIILISCGVPAFAAGEISIISPGASCTTELDKIEVSCDSATKIIYKLDGKVIGETAGETVLPIEKDVLSVGNHTLEVCAVFADRTAARQVLDFKVNKLITKMQATENFNDFVEGNEGGVKIDFYSQNGKHEVGLPTALLYPDEGRSGENGDKSLCMKMNTNKHVVGDMPYLIYNGFKGYGANGVITFKFDVKVSDGASAQATIWDMPITKNEDMWLFNGGKICGVSYDFDTEWLAIELVHDYVSGKTKVIVDGNEIYHDDISTASKANSKVDMRLYQPGVRSDENERAAIWLDNFDFKKEIAYGLSKIYFSDGEDNWTLYDNTSFPADASKIKLELTEELSAATVTAENIKVFENGVVAGISDVSYDRTEKSIIITPAKAFQKGSEIRVEVSDKVKFADLTSPEASLIARMNTEAGELTPQSVDFKNNGQLLISGAQIAEGDVVSVDAVLKNDTDTDKNMAVILYVLQNKKLRAIAAVEENVSPGVPKPVTVTLPAITSLDDSGNVTLKLSICDALSSALPYVAYTEVN